MSENVQIRWAEKRDMKEVMRMIQELADFEKMPDGPKITSEILARDCFDANPPLFRCFVAEGQNGQLIGYSIFFNVYSTWEGKSLMMEDIYVEPSHRSKGIGKLLLSSVAKHALDTDCSRLDLHVLKWNPAKKFYESKGAVDLTGTEDWMFYRFNIDALQKLTADSIMSK